MTLKINRRNFILGFGSTILIGFGASQLLHPSFLPRRELLGKIDPSLYDVHLGRVFLRNKLKNDSSKNINLRFYSKLKPHLGLFSSNYNKAISEAVIADYRNHNTLQFKGWLFPETAILLCALAAIEVDKLKNSKNSHHVY